MKEHWELFPDPADPSKGLFINGMLGWKCTEISEVKMEEQAGTRSHNRPMQRGACCL